MAKLIAGSFLRKPLDVLLSDRGILPRSTLDPLLESSRATGTPLEDLLIREARLEPDVVIATLAESLGLQFNDLSNWKKPPGLPENVENLCSRAGGLAVQYDENGLTLVVAKAAEIPQYQLQLAGIEMPLRFQLTTQARLAKLMTAPNAAEQEPEEEDSAFFEDLNELAAALDSPQVSEDRGHKVIEITATQEGSSIVQLVNQMIILSVRQRASDIHIESTEEGARIRFRIDGVLANRFELPRSAASAFISRVMVMASLDITERILPQDGSFKVRFEGQDIEYRIASIPGLYDQNLTLRQMAGSSRAIGLPQLGMREDEIGVIHEQILHPHGMILVSGPTGSGKSTTLYALLEAMNEPGVKLITIEDPIERRMSGVQQIQVRMNRNDPERSLTFARGLRTILRLDPDVIMVGEIRDKETAEIAIQASLTGHLVLSTIHANSSLETLRRLQNMGVDSFLLIASLNLIIAQRLVRKLCSTCRKPRPLTIVEGRLYPEAERPLQVFEPTGCRRCMNSGYQGRVGMYEVLPLTTEWRDRAEEGSFSVLLAEAKKLILRTLSGAGLQLVRDGNLDFGELERVCGPCR